MKIRKADVIMVLIIVITMAAGVCFALRMRNQQVPVEAGGETVTLKEEVQEKDLVCTIEIRCDTILENLGKLDKAKAPYVPENGVLLETAEIAFLEGETVFDVLCHVCENAELQLEYSWTPMYDNYYIEGINHIYEFDCGGQSGWMYKVNDVFPNYGCSSYEVNSGDVIVWCYTCDGLGTDVGAKLE